MSTKNKKAAPPVGPSPEGRPPIPEEGKGGGGSSKPEAPENDGTSSGAGHDSGRDLQTSRSLHDSGQDLQGNRSGHDGGRDLQGNRTGHDSGRDLQANRSVVTSEGKAYCPNPNDTHLPKEFETRVHIIQRFPEMKTIEETFYVQEIRNEERIITVPKTRVLREEHQIIDIVPVIKQVEKTRIEIVHRIIEEEKDVTEMVPVIEMVDVPRMEIVPRVITYDHEEKVFVPVVVEVPRVRKVEVPTGKFCETPVGEYINPGNFNLLGKGHGLLKRTTSLPSSSESDDEKSVRNKPQGGLLGALGVGGGAAKVRTRKKSSSVSSSDNESKVNKGRYRSDGLGGPGFQGASSRGTTGAMYADGGSPKSLDGRQPANLYGNSPSTPDGRTSKKGTARSTLFQRIS